jgi:hypothetical protein
MLLRIAQRINVAVRLNNSLEQENSPADDEALVMN